MSNMMSEAAMADHHRERVVVRVGRTLLVLILSAAGIGKLFTMPEFRESLQAWTLIPRAARPLAAWGLPSVEVVPAVLLACRAPWRIVRWVVLVVVLGLIGGYVAQATVGPLPDCKCFGIWGKWFDLRASVMDKALMGAGELMVIALTWKSGDRSSQHAGSSENQRRRDMSLSVPTDDRACARGFTLVEVLVVIAIIAILIGLALPTIRSVRTRGALTTQVAKMADHAKIMHIYATDYKSAWPCLDPKAPDGITRWSVPEYPELDAPYMVLSAEWPLLLFSQYYDGNLFHQSFWGGRSRSFHFTPFYLTQAIWAEPAFWDTALRTGPEQWRATRVDEVRFPTSKCLLVNIVEPPQGATMGVEERTAVMKPQTPMAFVDGSARGVEPGKVEAGYPTGSGTWPGSYFTWAHAGMHTIGGVNGRDVR